MKNLRILLTNDDGIHAEGLKTLEAIAAQLSDDVWVVAPEHEQSGASHSLTLHQPIRVKQIEERRYAVTGTPTDCVLMAKNEILPKDKPIGLVLSGVNRGSNAGDDVSYSGTVAGAMEATVLGLPAMALSQLFYDGEEIHWETAEAFAPRVIKKLLEKGWPSGTFINLNFPACAPEQCKGTQPCAQGKHKASVAHTERKDPRGRSYYWLGGARDEATTRKDVDVARLIEGFVTVTPIKMDMTHYETLADINDLFND